MDKERNDNVNSCQENNEEDIEIENREHNNQNISSLDSKENIIGVEMKILKAKVLKV